MLNPATSLATIEYILPEVDLVMLMSVNPGFGGQLFIPSSLIKARELKKQIDGLGLQVGIEMDGGISRNTIGAAAEAGVNIFVAGSAVYGSPDYSKAIDELKTLAMAGAARRR